MVNQTTFQLKTAGHRDMHDITEQVAGIVRDSRVTTGTEAIKRSCHFLQVALVVGATLLMLTGCESSGQYEDDNVNLQFGNTNDAVQVQVQ